MRQNNSYISLWKLFTILLKINLFTFGGGYTIVPVIRGEFVTSRGLIDEHEMLDLIAVAQSGPGAMAINTSILVGYKLRGSIGAVIAVVAAVLPCLVIISLVSYFYQEFSHNFYIRSALRGMGGAISAVLILTVIKLGKNALKSNLVFSAIIMIIIYCSSIFLKVNTAYLLLFCAISGILYSRYLGGKI